MGALVTRALRPIRTFNIENRAHRVISKEKPTRAPMYSSSLEDMKRAIETDPNLDEKLDRKDTDLDDRLRNVYVTSTGKPEVDVSKEQQSSTRPLPQNKLQVEDYEYGFKEPEKIPYGRTTLRHVITFLAAHQADPTNVTVEKIAMEYKLKVEDVANIVTHFKTFEVYIPGSKDKPALFAGPSSSKYLEQSNVKQLEEGSPPEQKKIYAAIKKNVFKK